VKHLNAVTRSGRYSTRFNLGGSRFEDVNLGKSSFTNVNFGEALFKNVNLGGATILSANLAGLTVKAAEIRGFTIFDIPIDELVETELDRRDSERASLRISDIFDPDEVRTVMARLDQLRDKFCGMLRLKNANLLAQRPEPDEWSAIEVVRHLVHAEDYYLNRLILQNYKPYIKLGLLPDHTANIPEFAEVGIEPTTDLETVLTAWKDLHTGTQEYTASVTTRELQREVKYADGTIGSLLQLFAHHELLHYRQAEASLAVLE
jgi:hypothetical protein